jgi:hypothetical protein
MRGHRPIFDLAEPNRALPGVGPRCMCSATFFNPEGFLLLLDDAAMAKSRFGAISYNPLFYIDNITRLQILATVP